MTNNAELLRREHATLIFAAAIAAVDPRQLVAQTICKRGSFFEVDGDSRRFELPLLIVGAGKAAGRMAAACEDLFGPEQVSGCVVVSDGATPKLGSIEVCEAGHPIPDERGVLGAQRILELLDNSQAPTVLALISGGASSLLVGPRPPVTLADKIATTELLLRCGADISEINPVRKHLSTVKGGGLLRRVQRPFVSLIISDVVGDDPSTIGSGPTVADPTTFDDAWRVIERYRLVDEVPGSVRQLLQRGTAGKEAETLKPGVRGARNELHRVVGSNRTAIEAAAVAARRLAWRVEIIDEPLVGDTAFAAQSFGRRLQAVAADGGLCVLAGGETTVEVKGPGLGGRNQEFALCLGREIAGTNSTLLSAGTDGIDGPTDAAGAFVDGTTLDRCTSAGLHPEQVISVNDSYTLFERLGDLFRCGPTGTNVMDIKVALIGLPTNSGAD